MKRTWFPVIVCLALLLAGAPARAKDTLNWRVKQNQVDAEIERSGLIPLLKKVALATGWKVYVEPDAGTTVSVKFKNLSQDEALARMLGKLNYAKDQSNGITRLRVYCTLPSAATQIVPPEKKD